MIGSDHPNDLPLSIQIAFDLVASHRMSIALIAGAPGPLRAAASRWFTDADLVAIDRLSDIAIHGSVLALPAAHELDLLQKSAQRLQAGSSIAALGLGRLSMAYRLVGAARVALAPADAVSTALGTSGVPLTRSDIGRISTPIWAALAAGASRAKRPDLVDRLTFAHRRSLAPSGSRWGDLAVLVARRGR